MNQLRLLNQLRSNELVELSHSETIELVESVKPAELDESLELCQPKQIESIEPVELAKPIDLDEPSLVELAKPIDLDESSPVEPANPIELDEPSPVHVEPAKPIDLDEPSPVEPAKPIELDEPAPVEPAKPIDLDEPSPVEPAKPIELDEPSPVEPAKPIDLDEPAKPIELDEPSPVEPAKPIDLDEPSPVEPAKPIELDEPAPVEPAKPIEPVDSSEQDKPAKPAGFGQSESVKPIEPVNTVLEEPDEETDIAVGPVTQYESIPLHCETEDLNSSSEKEDMLAESQGFQLYTEQLEHELDAYFSTIPQKFPSTSTQKTANDDQKLEYFLKVPSSEEESVSSEPDLILAPHDKWTLTDTDDKDDMPTEASLLAATAVRVPAMVEPEPTLLTGRDTPPGPLEQSQTTITFNLIEEQYNHVFKELSSIKANQNYRSTEDLVTTPPQDTTALVVNGNSEHPSLQLSPRDSLLDTPTLQASPEPPITIHPDETTLPSVISVHDRDHSASPEVVDAPKSYIVDRVSQLTRDGSSGRENDFLLSCQTFQKQYRVEDNPVKSKASKSKKSKIAHFKIQTKTSGKGGKKARETTI